MKLSHDSVWTISKEQLRILKTVEKLTKLYELVPLEKIKLQHKNININPYLYDLCKSKFLKYETLPYLSYRLTISGYDCLAITSLRLQGLEKMGDKVGIGKESDIYYGQMNGNHVILKFHRLGRTSFRTVKNNRDYHQNRKTIPWLLLNKLSAEKEYSYLKLFSDLCIPKAYTCERHVVVMEYLDDYVPMYCTKAFDCDVVYEKMMVFIRDLWHLGYVHGDFNEFNIMIKDNNIKVIDFPQCVEKTNNKANEYLIRDIESVKIFFRKKFRYTNDCVLDFE